MDRYVPLEPLSEEPVFPPDLADRILYDPQRGRLGYRGFMSKCEFDRLEEAHPSWTYRRALEDLFRMCALPPTPSHPSPRSAFDRLAAWLHRPGKIRF